MMNPSANDPVRFTIRVPIGNVPPIRSCTNAVKRRRATPPAALPNATYAMSLFIALSRARCVRSVENHLCALQCDQSAGNHSIELRKNPLDVLRGIDALDDYR